jgi:hypothetical protein
MKGYGHGHQGTRRIKDGRSRRRHAQECGVWTPHGWCTLPQKRFGRCLYHLAALKGDSHFELLLRADPVGRKRIIAVLDGVQKVRPRWQYENEQGEQFLIQQAAEQENANG